MKNNNQSMPRFVQSAIRTSCTFFFVLMTGFLFAGSAFAQSEFRINAGGADYTDSNGNLFVADKAFTAGDFGFVGGVPITLNFPVNGTTDQLLYQSLRADLSSFSYVFDNLADGDYTVTLHFFDIDPVVARVFDVLLEDVVQVDDLDITAAAGSTTAHTETRVTSVTDGQLNIDFDVVAGNGPGVVGIEVVGVPTNQPPTIDTHPGDTTVNESSPATFSVAATGSAPVTYQWRRNSVNIAGATGTSYTLDLTSAADDGATFDVVATNSFGSVTSNVASLFILIEDIQFTDMTSPAGIFDVHGIPDTALIDFRVAWMSGGSAAEDFDGDGLIDLYFVQAGGGANRMYMNNGDGTFTDEAVARNAALSFNAGMGACAADYDNDSDIDLVVTIAGETSRLLVNDGSGNFSIDATMLASGPTNKAMSCSWGDINNDGMLELAIGQWNGQSDFDPQNLFMYLNEGNGQLTDFDFQSTTFQDIEVFVPRFADLNNDRLADLPVNMDFFNSQLYINVGQNSFQNVTATNGTGGPNGGANEMGMAVADYDNDGDLDWLATSIYDPLNVGPGSGNRLYQNNGDGTFQDATDQAGVRDGNWGWGAVFGDLDNDGDLDLYHVNGWANPNVTQYHDQPARLFKNQGDGTFIEVAAATGADEEGQGRGVSMQDYDNDGDLDIFIINNQDLFVDGATTIRDPGPPVLLRNDTANGNNWLKVTLDGSAPLHSHGIGSRVFVTATGLQQQMRELHASSQFLSQGPGRIAHFGLASNTTVSEIRAEWVTGDATIVDDVAANQSVSLPSPVATISNRSPEIGELVTVSAPGESNQKEWLIEGQVFVDSGTGISTSFTNVGPQDVELRVFDGAGVQIVRRELLRITVTSGNQPGAQFRINAGGADYTDSNGNLFVADKAFTAGDFGFVGGIPITLNVPVNGTTDQLLYQSLRADLSSFSYVFDNLDSGDYTVTLHFFDIDPVVARVFDVLLEDVVQVDDLNITAAAGSTTAHTETRVTSVTDGQLNIDFNVEAGNGPGVVGIEVVAVGSP